MCDLLREVDQPEGTEESLKCSDCSGKLVVARDVGTPLSEFPWTSFTINLAKEAMEHNRRVHDLKAHGVVKDESKESKGKGRQPFIHKCFGHDQRAIEGFKDCDRKLRQALAREMAERNASTEFAGVAKSVQNNEVQEDDDVAELKDKDDLELDSQKIDDEDEDLLINPNSKRWALRFGRGPKRSIRSSGPQSRKFHALSKRGERLLWKPLSAMTIGQNLSLLLIIRDASVMTKGESLTFRRVPSRRPCFLRPSVPLLRQLKCPFLMCVLVGTVSNGLSLTSAGRLLSLTSSPLRGPCSRTNPLGIRLLGC